MRIAFVTSHPIQYQVPVFRCLAARQDLEFIVLFAMLPDAAAQGAGFGVAFEWDIPLLEGYQYRVLRNVSRTPGVTHFSGCDTPELESVLRELKIDVVVVNGWVVRTCLQALRAAKRMKIPCIVRGEANNLRKRPWWKRVLQRQLVRRYDAVLPIGKANREFYLSHGVLESRMFPAPYCIENARFARAAADAEPRRAELRSEWKIPAESVCLLFCGKFERKKHPVELVQAFLRACESLRQSGAETAIHLLMVGDGELRDECEQLVAGSSLRATVTFAGFLNQTRIVDAYVACDILALPSDTGETWGLVVNEAMACGKPAIVSSDVGCAEDLITEQKTGWVFRSGEWDELQTAIQKAAGDLHLNDFQGACRQRISGYAPEVAADGIAKAAHAVTTSP